MLNDLQSDKKYYKRDHRNDNTDDDLFGQQYNIMIRHNLFYLVDPSVKNIIPVYKRIDIILPGIFVKQFL